MMRRVSGVSCTGVGEWDLPWALTRNTAMQVREPEFREAKVVMPLLEVFTVEIKVVVVSDL